MAIIHPTETEAGRKSVVEQRRMFSRRKFPPGCAALLAMVAAAVGIRPTRSAAEIRRTAMTTGPVGRMKWIAFYGQSADEATLSAYDLIVLDPLFQGDIARIGAGGGRLCAYLSLGEVRQGDESFERIDTACLLQQNPAWPGTWRVDVRKAAWRDFVLRVRLPAIRARGFTGLMLDTLDTPPWLEQVDPVANRGMRRSSIELVQAIRQAYPDMFIIMNRGYAILSQLCTMIDAVLAESLLTSPGPGGGFLLNQPGEVETQLAWLIPAKQADPPIPILTLDYWAPADMAGMRKIYRRQRALGHHPYVATPLLADIIFEPGR